MTVKPSLDDVQEVLTLIGKIIAGVARGVSQWNSRVNKVRFLENSYPIFLLSRMRYRNNIAHETLFNSIFIQIWTQKYPEF